ncbi:MAG TPA: purine-binding chemotaxis protein CheW [Candidatus Desulfofervidus auxilii]|uniref:Chemotaxis protein CheW n=1 Tax=Desulfofervidus auxilii TaxID=1621989 RepID=A0A7V1N2N0_DESA2|nr:purine-binding chemotaxis protein CheW [Candidatus Desulfofervidus auxilii]
MNKKEHKYLIFSLNNEDYGLDIFKVKEIIGIMDITPVPHTPEFIKGVINLRGKVIPVIDLRLKFSLEPKEYDERTCIIVVEVSTEAGPVMMGVVVDSVSEVLNISTSDIEPAPKFGTNIDTRFILGMTKTKDRVKILLDINRVLTREEIGAVTQTVEKSE